MWTIFHKLSNIQQLLMQAKQKNIFHFKGALLEKVYFFMTGISINTPNMHMKHFLVLLENCTVRRSLDFAHFSGPQVELIIIENHLMTLKRKS